MRRENENEIRKAAGDVAFPGYDVLEKESREEEPTIVLIVKDPSGNVVRRISGSASKGFHRVAWDLRYPPYTPTDISKDKEMSLWSSPPAGPMVAPGTYSVELAKLVNGSLQSLGTPQSFEVIPLKNASLPAQDKQQVLSFQKQTGELQRKALSANAVVNKTAEKLPYIKKAILDTPGADPELLVRARQIELQLKDIQKRLSGDPPARRAAI